MPQKLWLLDVTCTTEHLNWAQIFMMLMFHQNPSLWLITFSPPYPLSHQFLFVLVLMFSTKFTHFSNSTATFCLWVQLRLLEASIPPRVYLLESEPSSYLFSLSVFFEHGESYLTLLLPSFLLPFTDVEDLHTLHTRAGHHDLLRRPDSEPDADAQRWFRTAHRPRVRLRRPALTARDGRHRNGAPQCHLSDLWRYCKHTHKHRSELYCLPEIRIVKS